MKKQLVIGILAHVDAGKTTLSEGILYTAGSIRAMGRVDNQDAFLDTYALEKQRGITIFSKQARFSYRELEVTLLDTPGHVDFSAEMERTLQVLDYAVLVISGADGVQGHTVTLWKLLQKHRIPVFLFVNKMDQEGTEKQALLKQLQKQLDERCISFAEKETDPDAFYEETAMCEEMLMNAYLENGVLTEGQLQDAVADRKLFPCYFGSALKMIGVDRFLDGLARYVKPPEYGEEFGARVFKIARDEQGNRLTYMKITGGSLKVRQQLKIPDEKGEELQEEKVSQIRLYSGNRYETTEEAGAGTVCAVTGLRLPVAGQGLGAEEGRNMPLLVPVLTYRILLPEATDPTAFLPKLRQLEEEEPELHVAWDEENGEIQVQVMGQVQTEILKQLIQDRFGVSVSFGTGVVLYRETIANTVWGVGHYEPLRHYAEVHLKLEPMAPGSGLHIALSCPEEMLAKNWQRLVATHLLEREYRGVLAGFPITDMKITLVAGRAHLKHTEGGDFRQATYRAVRQGLMEAESVLLEPWYQFRLEVPDFCVGRAMSDLERMQAEFTLQQTVQGEDAHRAVLTGIVPVTQINEYQRQVLAYTKGTGRLFCSYHGYLPCHNAEEIIARVKYDPLSDPVFPPGSVFCSHGAGYYVPWDQVKEHCHVPLTEEEKGDAGEDKEKREPVSVGSTERIWLSPEEIDRILASAGGSNQRKNIDTSKRWGQRFAGSKGSAGNGGTSGGRTGNPSGSFGTGRGKPQPVKEKYLLVDGYNIIFAWEELHRLAQDNIDGARGKLMDMLCNYQAFESCRLILVFDAYRVKGHQTEVIDYHNIKVVYTKEAETADQYIERFAHDNSKRYDVTVATSDGLEQIIIRSQGSRLLSARDFWDEICRVNDRIREEYLKNT